MWIGVQIQTHYEFPWAIAYPYAFAYNDNGGLRYYYTAEGKLTGPGTDEKQEDEDDGFAWFQEFAVASSYFRFNMRHKGAGRYTVKGTATMQVKHVGSLQHSGSTTFRR